MKIKKILKGLWVVGCAGIGIANTYLTYILIEKNKNLESKIDIIDNKINEDNEKIKEDNKKKNTIIELLARKIKTKNKKVNKV